MDRLKIPTLALMGLSFTAACDKDEDPIVGTWNATSIDGDALVVIDDYDEVVTTFKVTLTIGDDLTGVYALDYAGADYEDLTYDLTVDESKQPTYTISVPKAGLTLTCQVDGSAMTCDDGEVAYKFSKA